MVASTYNKSLSPAIQDHIKECIDFYNYDDAIFLAELNYEKEKTEDALLILADCQFRTLRFEELYNNLRDYAFTNPRLRYIFAKCCFQLNKLEDCERALTGDYFAEHGLHPSLVNSSSAPFAYNLLSRISSVAGRETSACKAASQAISCNPLHWSAIQEFLALGGQAPEKYFNAVLHQMQQSSSGGDSDKEQEKIDMDMGFYKTPTLMGDPNVVTAAPRKGSRRTNIAEARRSARLYAQDAENADSRPPTSRVLKASSRGSSRAAEAESRSPKRKSEKLPLTSRNSNSAVRSSSSSSRGGRGPPPAKPPPPSPSPASSSLSTPSSAPSSPSSTLHMLSTLRSLAAIQEALCQFQLSQALDLIASLPPSLATTAQVRVMRARVLVERGEYGSARSTLQEYRREHPFRVEGMEMLSTALWHEQDGHALSALAHTLTTQAKQRPESWCAAANAFSNSKQHSRAVQCLERAIRLDSRFVYSYTLLGCELMELEELERAGRAFQAALQSRPNDYRAWYGLAMVHQRREQLNLAQVNLEKAIDINPQNALLFCSLATLQQSTGRPEQALRTLDRALLWQPSSVACLYHKARLLYDLRHYDECLHSLNLLKTKAPDEANIFFLLGRVHKRLGDTHLALLHFNWASAMDPRGEKMLSDLGEPLEDEALSPA